MQELQDDQTAYAQWYAQSLTVNTELKHRRVFVSHLSARNPWVYRPILLADVQAGFARRSLISFRLEPCGWLVCLSLLCTTILLTHTHSFRSCKQLATSPISSLPYGNRCVQLVCLLSFDLADTSAQRPPSLTLPA